MDTKELIKNASKLKTYAASLDTYKRNEALINMAQSLVDNTDKILKANFEDVEQAKGKIGDVMLDRLRLDEKRILSMANGIREAADLPDPVGRVLDQTERGGLVIKKISVPLGLVAMIYESRPNVTSDAAALILKSGNVSVLRTGKEAIRSATAIVEALKLGLKNCGLDEGLVNLVSDTSRDSANEIMTADGYVDLLIPRGGKGLIKACVENATVPCIETGTGICHIYVDATADLDMALNIVHNAKTSRPSVCNAAEVCLVNKAIAAEFLPKLKERLDQVELRICPECEKYIDGTRASTEDFDTEFLDYILAVKLVGDADEAIAHINAHSTGHSEAIITKAPETAEKFTRSIDSAAVYVNASTRFTDGGEFGLGCEIGISTQKLHARGPMGLSELNTYKYIINGNGNIR